MLLKVIAIVIAVVSIVANALVCHVIVRLKTMKTSINYIILNLAILDATTGILTISSVLITDYKGDLGEHLMETAYNKSPILADVLCKVDWFYWLGGNTSPLLLAIMAYERYKAIVHPLTRLHGGVSKANLKWMLPLACITGLGFTTFEVVIGAFDVTLQICYVKDYKWLNFVVYHVVYLTVIYIIPSTTLLVFYIMVIRALRKQDNALGSQAEAERARRKARKKVMWIIITVTLVFYICAGIPHIVHVILNILDPDILLWDVYNYVSIILLSINSAFNPFVYFIFIQSFRSGLKHVLGIKRNILCCKSRIHLGSHQAAVSFANHPSSNSNTTNDTQNIHIAGLEFVDTD